jgi:hypothetical protein
MSGSRQYCKYNNAAHVNRIAPQVFQSMDRAVALLMLIYSTIPYRFTINEIDNAVIVGVINLHITRSFRQERPMPKQPPNDPKLDTLRQQGTLNPRPEGVTDELFVNSEFFDARDMVQVKYEMLRCVEKDGRPITEAASAFGFSRPSFYQAQSAFEQDGLVLLCHNNELRQMRLRATVGYERQTHRARHSTNEIFAEQCVQRHPSILQDRCPS